MKPCKSCKGTGIKLTNKPEWVGSGIFSSKETKKALGMCPKCFGKGRK